MNPILARKERFLRDPMPRRLGNVAADLARIRSFLGTAAGAQAVAGLIEECRHFAEWTAPEAGEQVLVLLRRLTRNLTRWRKLLPLLAGLPGARRALADEAGTWSKRLLAQAGLT